MRIPNPDLPYVTQYESNGLGYNNCGPACLTMLLAAAGLIEPSHEAMHRAADYIRDGVYDGNWNAGTKTDFPGMQALTLREHGTPSTILRTWQDVWARLDQGQPVILLVDNSVLQPRQYPATEAFNAHHFIVLTGWDAERYRVNDPLNLQQVPGDYTLQSIERGVMNVGGVYALALDVPVPTVPTNEEPPVSEEDRQIVAACRARSLNSAQEVHDLCDWSGGIWAENQALAAQIASQAAEVQALSAKIAAAPPAVVKVLVPAGVTVETEHV